MQRTFSCPWVKQAAVPFRVCRLHLACEVAGSGRGGARTPSVESPRKTGHELEGTEKSPPYSYWPGSLKSASQVQNKRTRRKSSPCHLNVRDKLNSSPPPFSYCSVISGLYNHSEEFEVVWWYLWENKLLTIITVPCLWHTCPGLAARPRDVNSVLGDFEGGTKHRAWVSQCSELTNGHQTKWSYKTCHQPAPLSLWNNSERQNLWPLVTGKGCVSH